MTHICPICGKYFCSKHFDTWWNSNKFNWACDSWALARFCYMHFDKWWNLESFNSFYLKDLEEYCAEHKDKWIELKLYQDLST